MFKRILVPLNGSTKAEKAIPYAVELCRLANGRLLFTQIVLSPVSPTPRFSMAEPDAWLICQAQLREEAGRNWPPPIPLAFSAWGSPLVPGQHGRFSGAERAGPGVVGAEEKRLTKGNKLATIYVKQTGPISADQKTGRRLTQISQNLS